MISDGGIKDIGGIAVRITSILVLWIMLSELKLIVLMSRIILTLVRYYAKIF